MMIMPGHRKIVMNETKAHILTLMLIILVFILLVTVMGLYIKVNKLQIELRSIAAIPESLTEAKGLELGTIAPAWTLTDIHDENVSLQDFVKDGVLLIFFSPQCPACIDAIPTIEKINESSIIQVVMISQGSAEENQRLALETGFSFPILSWVDKVAQDYKIPGTPFFYVIDSDLKIINAGFLTTPDLLETLRVEKQATE
ncbi:MAG: TlpA disulfide reductase family protein [Anaerolineae bacterium]